MEADQVVNDASSTGPNVLAFGITKVSSSLVRITMFKFYRREAKETPHETLFDEPRSILLLFPRRAPLQKSLLAPTTGAKGNTLVENFGILPITGL